MSGWPHQNSEYVIEATARWLRKFGEWPRWLEYPDEVARELIARGEAKERELVAAGYRPPGRRRDVEDAA